MLFNSFQFLGFFPIVTLAYYILPERIKNYWLLVASYYFYMCWNVKYVLLILTSTIITYVSGILIERIKASNKTDANKTVLSKIIVGASFACNLGILFYYKYFNFTLTVISNLLSKINIQLTVPVFDIVLPVGISFYTFQALSYTVDVYRNEIQAERNFFKYALFVSFFPQLVAGPIERSKNLLGQLSVSKKFNFEKARDGFLLMIWGYFLKVVLADRIAIFVNTVYGDFNTFNGWFIVVATMLFAVQIYCDFSGYSIIAMGAAEILGIELMDNFNAPYLSTSVSDFWRKWHISLTSWFKDYLYIPLGGSRRGTIRKYINKMIVFLVSGLWHGANLSFVIWGGLNGIYQVVGEILQPIRDASIGILRLNRDSIGHKVLSGIVNFVLIDFAWIFFRASGFHESIEIIKSMFSNNNVWILLDGSLHSCGLDAKNYNLMIISIFILLVADIFKSKGIKLRNVIASQDYWCRWIIMILSICFILIFGIWGSGYDAAGFIYFQF